VFLHCTPLSLLGLLYLDWDHVIHLQASHRGCQGREGNIQISQVMVFDISLFQHCFLSKLFSQQAVFSKICYHQLCVNSTLNKIKSNKFLG